IEAVQLREFFPTEDDVERCGILHHMLNTGRFRDRQHSRMTNHPGEQQLRYRNPPRVSHINDIAMLKKSIA
ncbi:hypothetical protein, partial [Acinetobacter baumannii]